MSESGDSVDSVTDQREDFDHSVHVSVRGQDGERTNGREVVFDVRNMAVYYGDFRAVKEISLPIRGNQITALIGPSGCGKTTVLRSLNRMNDLIEGARVEG